MNLVEQFIAFIQQQHLFNRNNRLLLAVSGGVDSVVLCHLCKTAGFNFGVAHCNFQLRGDDSTRDEAFVKNLCEQLEVPFYSVRVETKEYAATEKLSTQVAARNLRYSWFEELRTQYNYDFILTAHHGDDNIETLLLNFFRGTGIKGLTGMEPARQYIRRPLLFVRRIELENYLSENGLAFVQDESNWSNDYTRNFFRNEVLPMIAEVYPEVEQNLLGNIARMRDVSLLYKQELARLSKKLLLIKDEQAVIPILLLQKTPAMRTVLLELIMPYGFKATQLDEVLQLLSSNSGKYIVSSSHRILKDRKHLIISPLPINGNDLVVIKAVGNSSFPQGELRLSEADKMIAPTDEKTAWVDASLIQYPLLLRPWRAGDYFYPFGMKGKKKLAKFFIDLKLSIADKEKIWVLEMNRKIVWVLGYRLDDRFKVTDKTQSVLKIEWMMKKK